MSVRYRRICTTDGHPYAISFTAFTAAAAASSSSSGSCSCSCSCTSSCFLFCFCLGPYLSISLTMVGRRESRKLFKIKELHRNYNVKGRTLAKSLNAMGIYRKSFFHDSLACSLTIQTQYAGSIAAAVFLSFLIFLYIFLPVNK